MLIIRRLDDKDADIYQQIRLEALEKEPQSFGASYEETKRMSREAVAKRLVSSDASFMLGAFVDNILSGTCGMYQQPGSKIKHKGVIWGVYITPIQRGNGISRQLMLQTIETAKQSDEIEELLLTVVTVNTVAIRLYESLGFIEYGIQENALKVGDSYYAERMMRLVLNTG